MKKAFLFTYGHGGSWDCAFPCWVADDYDGDPYGDKCHTTVGSNQRIVTAEDGAIWDWCLGYCKGAGDFFMPVGLESFDTREDAEDFAETVEALCKCGRRTRAADEIMRQVKNELKDRGFMTLALRLAEAQDLLDERTD